MNRKHLRRIAAAALGIPFLCLLVAAAPYLVRTALHDNLYEVVPQRLYRAGEMSGENLGQVIDKHGIKSVIDLRLKGGPKQDGESIEAAVVAANGAAYRHLPMSSSRLTQRQRVLRLLDAFDEMTQPILVHCTRGADRSGVASAIWLLNKENVRADEAEEQLDLKFGFNRLERFVRSDLMGEPTLDRLIIEYRKASAQSPISFRQWARESPLLEEPVK